MRGHEILKTNNRPHSSHSYVKEYDTKLKFFTCLGACPQDAASRSPSTQPGFKGFFGFDPPQEVGVRGASFHEFTVPMPLFGSSPQPEFTVS
jgi:hypothetical protein